MHVCSADTALADFLAPPSLARFAPVQPGAQNSFLRPRSLRGCQPACLPAGVALDAVDVVPRGAGLTQLLFYAEKKCGLRVAGGQGFISSSALSICIALDKSPKQPALNFLFL